MILLERTVLDNPEIPARVKAFLYALNSYTNRQGEARVRRCKIARRMGRCVRTVSYAIRFCKEIKLIEVHDNGFHRAMSFKILCGTPTQTKASTPQGCNSCKQKEPLRFSTNVKKGSAQRRLSKQQVAECNVVVEDMANVLGNIARNGRYYFKIARDVPENIIYEALSWVKESIYDGTSRSPSGLFTWHLRKCGIPI